MSVARHPSTTRMFKTAAARWQRLQEQHRIACDRMWAGTVASAFTADELELLKDFLSPRDRQLLEGVKRASR